MLQNKNTEFTCLILEDDTLTRKSILAALQRFYPDAVVFQAADIKSAEQLLTGLKFDLIVLDLFLPDGSGIDFLAKAKMLRDKPMVLVLTGDKSDKSLRKALDLGADDFLTKPIDLPILESKVKSLRSKTYYSPLKFLTLGNNRAPATLTHSIGVTSLSPDRLTFFSDIKLQTGAKVELMVNLANFKIPVEIKECLWSQQLGKYSIVGQIGKDLSLTSHGSLRRLIKLCNLKEGL